MAKEGKDKYLDALTQAEAGIAVRDHLKHTDFNDLVINILKNHAGFSSIVFKALLLSAPFWGWILLLILIISLLVVKFPMVADWICSIIK